MTEPSPAAAASPSPDANPTPAAPARPATFNRGLREAIESIAIAFALAFLFKTFQAEAFVIPTGSMAPTLLGRHKDVVCPGCNYHYTASASDEADRDGQVRRTADGQVDESAQVISCTCPVCRFPMSVDPLDSDAADAGSDISYNGDRIWVSKVPLLLSEPKRWDIIVFRYPLEPQTYFIKRLVGLPNETLRIFHGDIYTKATGEAEFSIARKPAAKALAMAQLVHDNDYVAPALNEQGWPARWQAWGASNQAQHWRASADGRAFQNDGQAGGESWLRYQHFVPSAQNWIDIYKRRYTGGPPRPQLITDFYAFNTRVLRQDGGFPPSALGMSPAALGLHWVGDLMLECDLDVQGASGEVILELTKAGQHFRCLLDVTAGRAHLSIDGLEDWQRSANITLAGAGKHAVRFANFDRQLLVWIDNRLIAFDQPTTYDAQDKDHPVAGLPAGGDLAPVGIGTRGLAVAVNHLRVLRDIYYIADNGATQRYHGDAVISDFRGISGRVPGMRSDELVNFLTTPAQWESPRGTNLFDERQVLSFPLGPDQFFVMGDNSPASSDARLWPGQHFVERDLLVGKALFLFWPHALELEIPATNYALPIVPNVGRMGMIR